MGKRKNLKKRGKNRHHLHLMKKRCFSPLCESRGSEIHGYGVFATQLISSGTKIFEYAGKRITKEESTDLGNAQYEKSQKSGEGSVYLFTLSDKYDVNGNYEWNLARLVNHSCEPNCESFVEYGRIYYSAIQDIQVEEELTIDYGFGVENFRDHPCLCGSGSCLGYIVAGNQKEKLQKLLEKEGKKTAQS